MDTLALAACAIALVALAVVFSLYVRLKSSLGESAQNSGTLRMFESALDAASHGLVFFNTEGGIIWRNAHAQNFIPALAGSESGMKTFNDLIAYMFDYAVEGDESLENAAAKAPLTIGEGVGFREVLRLQDGRYCLAQAQKTVFGTVAIFSDITRQRRREEDLMRLARTNRDLIAAVEETSNGILISDPKRPGNPITFANEAFCRSADLPRESVIGRG